MLAAVFALAPVGAGAAGVAFSSGPNRVALVELFTSEGCSSCPPAERWLAERRTDPGLWRDFVPVAWHVTYWNNLGWVDRLSADAFTARQYAYAKDWGSESVYTPCLVRDGREWHAGGSLADHTPAGVLRASYDPRTGALHVEFTPAPARHAPLEIHAAYLGGGLTSAVRSGENAGHTLEHEFTVLAVAQATLVAGAADDHAALSLPAPADAAAPRRALAVWVTRPGELAPLQAAGGWIRP